VKKNLSSDLMRPATIHDFALVDMDSERMLSLRGLILIARVVMNGFPTRPFIKSVIKFLDHPEFGYVIHDCKLHFCKNRP
jgi:hypothetical protein